MEPRRPARPGGTLVDAPDGGADPGAGAASPPDGGGDPQTSGASPATTTAAGAAGSTAQDAPATRAGRWWPWALVGALVGVVQFAVVRGSLVDDAYITMTYARNVAFHHTWGLLSDVTSNTATSPLFVLVLALVTLVVRSALVALALVTVGSFALVGAALAGAARRTGAAPALVAPLGLLLLLVNPLLLSSAGLETLFLISLLAAAVWAGAARHPVVFGVIAGALVLTRVDSGVFVAVLALGLSGVRRRLHWAVLAALVVVTPWYLFSWFRLGSAIPDTLLLKQDESWGGWTYANGAQLYYLKYPVATFFSFGLPALGALLAVGLLLAALTRRLRWAVAGPWMLLALGAVGVYVAYSRLVVPPYHWYYGSAVGALSMVLAGGVGVVAAAGRPEPADRPGATAARGLPAWAGPALAGGAAVLVILPGVFDAARGPFWHQSAISTNWATPAQYLTVGADLSRALPAGVRASSPGEIGTLQYRCDCLVDQFSDPAVLRPVIDKRIAGTTGLGHALLVLNYRNLPPRPAAVPTPYQVFWEPGHRAAQQGQLATWPVTSPWKGDGTFVLTRKS